MFPTQPSLLFHTSLPAIASGSCAINAEFVEIFLVVFVPSLSFVTRRKGGEGKRKQ
jgi:hypothetical protein